MLTLTTATTTNRINWELCDRKNKFNRVVRAIHKWNMLLCLAKCIIARNQWVMIVENYMIDNNLEAAWCIKILQTTVKYLVTLCVCNVDNSNEPTLTHSPGIRQ